jgi:hypothetical protein
LQNLAVNYTLGAGFVTNPYHIRVIQSSLTRSIGARFADIHDEIVTGFQDEISKLLDRDSDFDTSSKSSTYIHPTNLAD